MVGSEGGGGEGTIFRNRKLCGAFKRGRYLSHGENIGGCFRKIE